MVTDSNIMAATAPQGQNMMVPAMDMGQPPEASAQEKEYVTWWLTQIASAEIFHKPTFDQMQTASLFARGIQWDNHCGTAEQRYTVNVVQSELQASTAALYAKNPTFIAKRKPRMDFKIWDETEKTMQEAMQGYLLGDPAAGALVMDIQEGKKRRDMLDRTAKTLQLLMSQQVLQQKPNFKRQMKQMVRRVETTKVGYLKLDFQRIGELKPEEQTRVNDVISRVASIETLQEKLQKEGYEGQNNEAKQEELRVSLKTLNEQPVMITQEGLVVTFPRSDALIIDPACYELASFSGARWVAERFYLTACKIKEIYGKDVRSKATPYTPTRSNGQNAWYVTEKGKSGNDYNDRFCVYELFHKDTGMVVTLCKGFDEYLREPTAPRVILERFFPFYALTFNDVEDESTIYPPSTVELIMDPQREINRAKESLRQHRIANRPHYAVMRGAMSEQEKVDIGSLQAHATIELDALQNETDVNKLMQQIKKHAIDPNTYDTNGAFEDIQRITRRSAAANGGVSNTSATADTIAADTRQAEDRSKSDDIDDFLTEFARDAGTTLLLNMSAEQVIKIVGPGAMWPEADPAELLQDIHLEIVAGSSGRPNSASEVAKLQRLFPILIQTPGLNPAWLAKLAIKMGDADVDLSEAYLEGAPSIQTLNNMMLEQAKMAQQQTSTGNPATDPAQQGAQGADKNPRPEQPNNDMQVSAGMMAAPDTATQNSILM